MTYKTSKIFYAMPFTGKSHADIVQFRHKLHNLAKQAGVELLEQFIGIEEEDMYESHGYLPLFIARKDHDLLKKADIVIADYSGHSIGRDCEIVLANEVFDKRVIAVVPDQHAKNHPYIRLYSNYIVNTEEDAFKLCRELASFPLSSEICGLSRDQKDSIDILLKEILKSNSVEEICNLLPTELKSRWQILFKHEYSDLLEWCFSALPKTARINTRKSSIGAFKNTCDKYSWNVEPLELSNNVYRFQLSQSAIRFGETAEYVSGMFYIQELASMLPAFALDPRPEEKVLDLCAAPGSKTTQMAELMENRGELLAVDISESRLEILKTLLDRHAVTMVKPLLEDGIIIGDSHKEQFDKVLVDGPCSCEGIFRYKPHKFFEWDLLQVYRSTEIQMKLLESGFKALKPDGLLVYSTCTYCPEENEAVVDWLLKKYETADLIPLHFNGIKVREGLTAWEHFDYDQRLSKAVRIYPQDNNTIGFFIAKIIKNK